MKAEDFVLDEDAYLLPILNAQNLASRLLSPIPSYLYFWLYSFLPAHNILTAAKILNAGFIAATALPAYALARRYLTGLFAAAFAIAVMISPITSFVRYVMPEPVYFFGFWLVVLVTLSAVDRSPLLAALASGILIGALSLIKPHALALALGCGLFLLLRSRRKLNGVIEAIVVFFSYYSIHILLFRVLTDRWNLGVTGTTYGTILGAGFHLDFWATAINAFGHICAIAILIAIPLAITVVLVIRRIFARAKSDNPMIDRITDLGLLACCMLATMLSMTIFFSQSAYQRNPLVESITRLHGRYYDYAFPLFVLVSVSLWQNKYDLSKICARWFVIALCIIALAAAAVIVDAFNVSYVDFPDLALAIPNARYAHWVLMALLLVPLTLACLGRATIGNAKLVFATALWCSLLSAAASAAIIKHYIAFVSHDPIDIAFFDSTEQHELQGLADRSDGVIVAVPGDFDVYRAIFYLHSTSSILITSNVRDADFPKEAHWAVLLPGVHYTGASLTTRAGALMLVWTKRKSLSESYLHSN